MSGGWRTGAANGSCSVPTMRGNGRRVPLNSRYTLATEGYLALVVPEGGVRSSPAALTVIPR